MTNKFKIWDKISEAWLKQEAVTIDGNGKVFLFGEYHPQNEMLEILWYTGLTDKNGNEVCKGDVVELQLKESKNIYTIEWIDYQFKMVHVKYDKMVWGCISRLSELNFTITIIGNIYETPKLLQP